MPRQNPALAREAQRSRDGLGPIYRRLLARERDQQARYGHLHRPRYLLDALEAGEAVTVPIWRVPVSLRPPGCGETVVVDPSM
ncbi:hypothetical protein [Mycolicibacterium sp. OfavD-34-C]|uniref:hypothetical protein n=1 Tax=Mycolicibacterium sp. OfavD-34-C TaxID=2917746 RepID=UPI001EF58C39|nr:hypothetical protein [Mycolicibacterium sp. OfavD-34-C]MCG7583682.1 hypothetical protein [Mycolicibacterium sp. OfavD-34-C]